MTIRQQIIDELKQNAIVRYRRAWASTLSGMAHANELAVVLNGVYAPADQATDPRIKILAARAVIPRAVITGPAAAMLSWDTNLRPKTIDVAGRYRGDAPGFRIFHESFDPTWVTASNDIALTVPAWTAVHAIPRYGAELIDSLLRHSRDNGTEVLEQMKTALADHPRRRGNALREAVLRESRDRPWSEFERQVHTILRTAGIEGWVTNHHILLGRESRYLDLAWPGLMLAVELHGLAHHQTPAQVAEDWSRHNDLTAAGWTVVGFTWHAVIDDPAAFIARIGALISQCGG